MPVRHIEDIREELFNAPSAILRGEATVDGTTTTLTDATMNFEVNMLAGKYLRLIKKGIKYVRKIVSNTATVITFDALPAASVAAKGDAYSILEGTLQVGGITIDSLTATTVGIDQTTPGTTNKVVAELSGSIPEGTAEIGKVQLSGSIPAGTNLIGEVQLSGSNVEQVNGEDAAAKSALVAGKTATGEGVPVLVDNDGKVQVGAELESNLQNRRMYPVSELTRTDIPTYDGAGQPVHPSVIYIAQGFGGYKYWMAFTPYTNSHSAVENPSICASNDGLNWEVPLGVTNPVFGPPEVGFHADTELIYDDDNKKLFLYFGHFGAGAASTNYRSESTDGVIWTEPTPINITGGYTYVRLSASSWVAWINNTTRNCFQRSTSSDGITWSAPVDVMINIPCVPWHISVFYDGTGYHFLMSAYPIGQPTRGNQCLYYGYSIDGDDIVYFDDVPLVMPDKNGCFSAIIYKSHMIPFDNQTYRVYVSGMNLDGSWGMGYIDVKRVQKNSYEMSKLATRGKGAVTYYREGELAASSQENIINTSQECYLEYLSFSTSIESTSFLIYVKDHHNVETPVRFALKDGTKTEYSFKPSLVRVHKPPKFELAVDAPGTYAISLKAGERLYFPHGCRIVAYNGNATAQNVTLAITLAYKY